MAFGRNRNDSAEAQVDTDDNSVAAEVLRFLTGQHLPPTPVNYELGYLRKMDGESLAGRAIDAILMAGQRVTQAQADQIVSAYRAIGGGGDVAKSDEEAPGRARLRQQTLQLAEVTADAMNATGQFGRDLSEGLSQIDPDCLPFAPAISAMIVRSGEAEQSLQSAMDQIDALHAEVAAARNDASRDALTGLANRRGLQAAIDALAPHGQVALAICDIDRFKSINDCHGHSVGDRVLKAVAESIAASCAPHVVARWGGEEFVVLMPDLSLPAAADIIQNANLTLQRRTFRVRETDQSLPPITFSAGIVPCHVGGIQDAITAADALLYRAKDEGRNRVLVEEPPEALAA